MSELSNTVAVIANDDNKVTVVNSDSDLLDWWENHKQYVVGFAPSGSWSGFNITGQTCYAETLRDCLKMLKVMHEDITGES